MQRCYLCVLQSFSDCIPECWALRTHPEHLNSDQKNSFAIVLIHLLFPRIIKLEIPTADLIGHAVYHVDVYEPLKV